jgi:hypothetical protein
MYCGFEPTTIERQLQLISEGELTGGPSDLFKYAEEELGEAHFGGT